MSDQEAGIKNWGVLRCHGREWRLLLGLALSAICLYLAVRGISLVELESALAATRWQWVIGVVAAALAGTLLKSLRWQTLFLPQRVGLGRAWSIFMIGQMLNAVLPARAGEVGRIYYIGETQQISRTRALSTVLIEKMVDLVMLALAYLLTAAWLATTPVGVGVQDWQRTAGMSVLLMAALALLALLLFVYGSRSTWRRVKPALRLLPSSWRGAVDGAAEQAISAFESLRHGRVSARVWSYSLAIWLVAAVSNGLLFLAFRMSLSPWVALLLLVVLMSGVAMPPLPGNLGVFPYLCQLVLSLFGYARETGLAYGLVLQAAAYLPVIVLGLACLLRENLALRRSPSAPASSPGNDLKSGDTADPPRL